MHSALRGAVLEAHRRMERHTEGVRASCRKGCAFCCLAWVVVGLAEAEYLWTQLPPHLRLRVEAEGPVRLERLVRQKGHPRLPTRHFLEARPCPLLTAEGACGVYPHRPLACRGVLTDLDARYCAPGVVPALRGRARLEYLRQLGPRHGPEHYLRRPWQAAERLARQIWAAEQQIRGFTVVGELVGLLYLAGKPAFQRALALGKRAVRRWLAERGLLGGRWGFWVG
ncbi:YkgJ family cysteine cluster protein [Meiothermus sp. QL-1]|uniref:YkgJ family cysteine cluster protein n=1 Tax=Meiothermus sp. QL-1 TaxID=2058095 RepID=UPI000E09E29D|nr:YkgJ family cysteine cluster protein [Meiothermus sp. QL-1]RDI95633.1 YkgJ family cysteine cluster protein [Meiothermus sp. QL-1]